jgi:SSS family transporter
LGRASAGAIRCALLAAALVTAASAQAAEMLRWSELPGLPDPIGVAGPFVGVHAGVIVVAGGANFPVTNGADRWQVPKVWHDAAWVFAAAPGGPPTWRAVEPLGRRVAYGASASTPRGVVCVGGDDGTGVFDTAALLTWDPAAGRVNRAPLPALPQPLTCGGAAAIGSVVYVACGQQGLGLDTAGAALYRLDVGEERSLSSAAWERLADVPGGARAFPVVVAQHNGFETCVYVMSGRRAARKPGEIEPLRDVQEFAPRGGGAWRRRADLPRAVMAGTAVGVGQAHVFVLSGDDGGRWREVDALRDAHPGFPRRSLAYHTITDTWIDAGPMPANQVATTAVRRGDAAVIVSGEVRPRQRTPAAWKVEPVAGRTGFGALNTTVLVAYLVGTLALGAWFTARNRDTDDFFRGGQRVPWWAAGLSIYATALSSITYMGIPAKGFAQDWVLLLGNLMIVAVAPLAVHVALPFYRRLDATSAYEYLERRFSRSLRLFGSGCFMLYHLFRMAIVMALAGLALAAVTPLSPAASVLVIGLASVAYCVLGGLEAVIWTDVIQTVVLLGGAIACLAVILVGLGGAPGDALAAAWDADKLNLANWHLDAGSARLALLVVVLGAFGQHAASYISDQAIVQRYMTTPDERLAARAIWTNAVMAVPGTVLFFAIGAGLWLFYRAHPERLDPTFNTDQVLPLFIAREMPAGLAGLVVAGVFAAAQSTVSTSVNSAATTVVTDFLQPLRLVRGAGAALVAARAATLAIGCGGTLIGLAFVDPGILSLFDRFIEAIGLVMGVLGGLFLLGMLSRRANAAGAVAGVIAGATVLGLVAARTSIQGYLYAAIGIVACMTAGWLASLAWPPPPASAIAGLTVWTPPHDTPPEAA